MNRTNIANIVNAVFTLGHDETLINLATPKAYEFGLFAQQDIKALASALWTTRTQIIGLMYVEDRALQDRPQPGSLEDNDTGRGDENAEERAEAIKILLHEQSIIERRIRSLELQAKEETEEAGRREHDGSRFKFNRTLRPFTSFIETFDEWISKRKAEAQPNSPWLAKLEAAQELVPPHVTAQDAIDEFKDLVDASYVDKTSAKAWDRLLERFEMAGACIAKHDKYMADVNALTTSDLEKMKPLIAIENREYRDEMRSHEWWLKTVLLEPVALLAHSGTPKILLDSPEWRTHVAKRKASDAQAKAQEALAQTAEAEATILQIEANMTLFNARKQLAATQAKLDEQLAQMNAMFNPPASQPAPQLEVPAPEAPKGRKPRVITGRGAAGFAH